MKGKINCTCQKTLITLSNSSFVSYNLYSILLKKVFIFATNAFKEGSKLTMS